MKTGHFVLAAFLVGTLACTSQPADTPAADDTAPGAAMPDTHSGGTPAAGMASGSKAATTAARTPGSAATPAPKAPAMMEMEVPAGTPLVITLETPVSSATSKAEDSVRGRVARAVAVSGMTTIPEGATVTGTVVEAEPSGRVKGRARIALRFNRVVVANTPYDIRTARIVREAEATKGEDAKKVGIGAGAGAVVGAIAGGKKGAAIGTAVGAGAGGGAVLATKGDEVTLGSGATLRTTIESAVRINAPM